jgi:hypothetical protein
MNLLRSIFRRRRRGLVAVHFQIPAFGGSSFVPFDNYVALSVLTLFLSERLRARRLLIADAGQLGELCRGGCGFDVSDVAAAAQELQTAMKQTPELLNFFCRIAVWPRGEPHWKIVFPAGSSESPAGWFTPDEMAREKVRIRERAATYEKEIAQWQ